MEQAIEEIEYLVGDNINNIDNIVNQTALGIFEDITLDFLAKIADVLLKSQEVRQYPDVATFAFYCRKANLRNIKIDYLSQINCRLGKGVIFHITPGNVPVNFAYSLLAGLLTGNINIVRIPSNKFIQVDLIINAIKTVLIDFKFNEVFSNRLYLIRYNRESNATAIFSKICDVRIIWGGNQTINNIRNYPISPKSTELTFSDRYSIAIIDVHEFLKSENKSRIASDFFNDTYLFDQNACTSPQTIFWLGTNDDILNAQTSFWNNIKDILIEKKYELNPIVSIDKLTTFYSQAINQGNILKQPSKANDIWRTTNLTLSKKFQEYKCSCGYFNEASISNLDDLIPLINRTFQTIAYFGFSKEYLATWINNSKLLGIDRVVPIGKTMDFNMTWDGHDLIYALSRKTLIM